MRNSSNYRTSRNLAGTSLPTREAKEFLCAFANLHDEGATWFKEQFGDIMPAKLQILPSSGGRFSWGTSKLPPKEISDDPQKRAEWTISNREVGETVNLSFLELRDLFQLIWREPDLRRKRLGVNIIWRLAATPFGGRTPLEIYRNLPAPTPFEVALDYLATSGDLTRYCMNPECVAPYFFAKRSSQKYCSNECSLPAQRDAKLRWWKKRGRKWREAQRASASKQASLKRTTKKRSTKGR